MCHHGEGIRSKRAPLINAVPKVAREALFAANRRKNAFFGLVGTRRGAAALHNSADGAELEFQVIMYRRGEGIRSKRTAQLAERSEVP